MIPDSYQGTVLVVAHDAGGAETISSYVKQRNIECIYSLQGPAYRIFERKIGAFKNQNLEEAIPQAGILLCGTSWQSDIELTAIRRARELGCRSIAWLDHWVNYKDRFQRCGVEIFPDEVWVSDSDAYKIAAIELPGVRLQQYENPYYIDIKEELARASKLYMPIIGKINVLFVCEPVKEHALLRYGNPLYWGYTEEQALHYFLSNIHALGLQVNNIIIRTHPSEPTNKYLELVREFNLSLRFSQGRTLAEDVAVSDCVVGCNSMAMIVGLLGGKRVVSCIPPGGAKCKLPQKNIEIFHQLVLNSAN